VRHWPIRQARPILNSTNAGSLDSFLSSAYAPNFLSRVLFSSSSSHFLHFILPSAPTPAAGRPANPYNNPVPLSIMAGYACWAG
jgi:hypothetical protein